MSEHHWEDDALRSGGRAWVTGVAFTCGVCGMQRRVFNQGDPSSREIVHGQMATAYFRNGLRVYTAGECKR